MMKLNLPIFSRTHLFDSNRLTFLTLTLALITSLTLSSVYSEKAFAKKAETSDSSEFVLLSPDDDQRTASIQIARQLLLTHYLKKPIDKHLSEQVYESYLKGLDGQHLYFLQSDIDSFEPYRFRLQDALKTGQLDPAFRIYNRYEKRVIERLHYLLNLIDNKLDTLDFTKNESILANREDTPWAKSKEELDDIWRRRLKSAALSIKLNGKTMAEAGKTLKKRYANQLKRMKQIRSEDAFQAYMNAFTAAYDPHTSYFSPRTSENFNINMSLSLEGIGAVLQSDNEYTKVLRLVPGGPASKQGQLQPADRIVGVAQGVDGEMVNVVGWRLDEVVDLIRGKKHSTVRLEVIPADSQDDTVTKEIRIVRDKVKLEEQAAQKHEIELQRNGKNYRIGVIDIPTFYADFQGMQSGDPNYKSTTRDVTKLIKELEADGPIDGLVIDLRNNGGGSLDEANRLTGLFIKSGPTVQIRSANDSVEMLTDPDPKLVYGGPLIVLVNRLSASASEIFTGAIQDYGRGVVMGGQTFGKGTVQSVRALNHGQIKITQAKFYRISGASTQHNGVMPDILIPSTIDKNKIGEDALPNPMHWDAIKSVQYKPFHFLDGIKDTLSQKHKSRFQHNAEFKVLQEEISFLNARRDKKTISLNEQQRKKEQKQLESEQLKIINDRRKAQDKSTFKTFKDWEDFQEKEAAKQDNEKKPDFIVKEGGEVLLDLIEMSQQVADTRS